MLAGTEELDWMKGIEALSLDFVAPIYQDLGVGVDDEIELRRLARATLDGCYSGTSLAFEVDSWPDSEIAKVVWIAPFIEVVRQTMGPRALDRLRHWVKYVYCSDEERNPWVAWEEFFSSWAAAVLKRGGDSTGRSHSIAKTLRMTGEIKEIRAKLERQLV